MKKLIYFIPIAILLVTNSTALAVTPDKSLGIIIGDPVGVSFKYWIKSGFLKGDAHAIDTALGWKLDKNVGFELKSDYIVHQFGIIPVKKGEGKAPFYYGIGGRILIGEQENNMSVRVPVGVNYLFEDEPFDVFLELAPLLIVYPETEISLSLGLGGRYRFR